MTLPHSPLSRKQVCLLLLALTAAVLVVGMIRIADYHPLSPTPEPSPVPENANPETVFDHARPHLNHLTVTARVHTNVTEATAMDTTSAPVRFVFKSDPERNRLHGYMYHYDENQTWTTSCSYITDGASIAKTGTVHSATNPDFCTTGSSDWYSFDRKFSGEPNTFSLNDWQGLPSIAEAWKITARNESTIVLRTTSFEAFVAMEGGTVDEDIKNGSYTMLVNAQTGRLTHVERVINYQTAGGGVRREVTVYRFSKYGETDVSPPDALGYPTLEELVHDIVVY